MGQSRVRFALLATLTCAAPAAAQTPPLPAGWERPKDADLIGNWEFRRDKPHRYARAEGDFNGDGKQDRAELLIDRKAGTYALFAFLGGAKTPVELEHQALSGLGSVGISTEPPGRKLTICGKGYYSADPQCKKGIPFIDVRFSSIGYFAFESATSEFYWTGSKFERFWTSD